MKVLSLFDGCGMAYQAMKNLKVNVERYYASEIDKYAIQIAMKNHPDIVQLGDIKNIKGSNLPNIDLVIGGSPCQGFSFAGLQLNFKDDRSKLFFEFVRLLNEVDPKYFILENVKMKKEYQKVISECLGVEPVEINSNLVSAQNRKRLYWTNIPGVLQPEDKNIFLKDILEKDFTDREKSFCLDANYYKGGNLKNYFEKHRRQIIFEEKFGKDSSSFIRFLKNTKSINDKASCLTSTMYKGMASNGCTNIMNEKEWRKLTPIECERLQTVPDNYTQGVSNTQRYKMLGNGFTVAVIEHILKSVKEG